MKLTIDICDCDKACLIRDWLPCPHLTNERPPLALSDQSAASVLLSGGFLLVPPAPGNHWLLTTPSPSPVSAQWLTRQHGETGDTDNWVTWNQRNTWRPWGPPIPGDPCDIYMRGTSCDQAWSVVNFKSCLTKWRHAGGSRHLGQVTRPAPGNWQQICGGETAEEGKLGPRAGSRSSLDIKFGACFKFLWAACRVWCHHFMARVTKSWLNIVSVISHINMLHPS